MKSVLLFAALAISSFANASELGKCQDLGVDLSTLVQPVGQNERTYANNTIAVYNIDTEEPAAASAGLAIVFPDPKSETASLCFALINYEQIDINESTSSYDASKG